MRHDERAIPRPTIAQSVFVLRAQARAVCSREPLISTGPACINIGYRVSLRLLAETFVAAGGAYGKECTRTKIAF